MPNFIGRITQLNYLTFASGKSHALQRWDESELCKENICYLNFSGKLPLFSGFINLASVIYAFLITKLKTLV